MQIVDTIDHRNFLLKLHPMFGEQFAQSQGFIPPDSEVQFRERLDTVAAWQTINKSGMGEYIAHAAIWMVKLMKDDWWPEGYEQLLYYSLVFAMGSNLDQLKEAGMLQFAHDTPVQFTMLNANGEETPLFTDEYSYKDLIGHLDFEPDLSVP